MFKIKGIFSKSSNWVKILLIVLIPIFIVCLISAIWALFIKLTGLDPHSLNMERFFQSISSISIFIFGGYIVAYLIYENPLEALQITSMGKCKNYLYGTIAFIALLPIVSVVSIWNEGIVFPEFLAPIENWMRECQEITSDLQMKLLSATSFSDLLINLVVLVLIPALGEELLFRGLIQNYLKNSLKNVHVAIIISAIIFSSIHLQFYGFFPRFILGVALGYLAYFGRSLWLPILAHFINNALVVINYWGLNQFDLMKKVEANAPTTETPDYVIFIIGCAFVVALSFYKLYTNNIKNSVPTKN